MTKTESKIAMDFISKQNSKDNNCNYNVWLPCCIYGSSPLPITHVPLHHGLTSLHSIPFLSVGCFFVLQLVPRIVSHSIWSFTLTWPLVIYPPHVTHTLAFFQALLLKQTHKTAILTLLGTSWMQDWQRSVFFGSSLACSLAVKMHNGLGAALGLPWLAIEPRECAFLMLPWPQRESWLVELIVAAGPNGNRWREKGKRERKGVVIWLDLVILSLRLVRRCSCFYALTLFVLL